MTLQQYSVSYSVNGTSWTSLTNLESMTINIGNQAQLEQIKASTAQFTFRYPTGYASPIAELVPQTFIRVLNTTPGSGNYRIYTGRIANVSAEYGIPYSAGVGVSDYLFIDVEGFFAEAGRAYGNGYAMSAGTANEQFINMNLQTGFFCTFFPTTNTPQIAATNIDNTWGDWVSQVALTTNARLVDSNPNDGLAGSFSLVSPFDDRISTINFSDTTNDSTNQVYNEISFGSLADNYYTRIIVTPESYAEQVVPAGSTSGRTYQVNTLSPSVTNAYDYANYLLANYDEPQLAITSVTCMAEAQNVFNLDKIGLVSVSGSPGYLVNVAFRGTTYPCVIEGVTISATPSGSRFTFYLSGGVLNSYLRLDNATFGRLDYNKLGF